MPWLTLLPLRPFLPLQSQSPLYLFRHPFNRTSSSSFLICKAKSKDKEEDPSRTDDSPLSVPISVLSVSGLLACPLIAYSLYTLKTTGCGLPPGPGGSLGALEGVSYLIVGGIVAWSILTKVRTGSGLPAGPYGLLGAAEGFAYLTLVAIILVFGLQIYETGSLPGPLPSQQCFG